jgi:cytoskeletal protein RodZ
MLSVGTLLKSHREKNNLTLSDVEKQLKIRKKFIIALESDAWDTFTSKIYIEGILKNYAHLVHLDDAKILAFFRREYEKKDDVRFKRQVRLTALSSDSKKILITGFIAICVVLCTYFFIQLYLFFKPPTIVITAPRETTFHHETQITVVGHTEKEAVLTIGQERVYLDKDGGFQYIFALAKPKNTVHLEVVGANGKKTVLEKVFMKTE